MKKVVRFVLGALMLAIPVGFFATPFLFSRGNSLEDLYVERNERLLASLPILPGAREIDRRTDSYRADPTIEASPIGGYRTKVVYEAPSRARAADVIRFYRAHLRRWNVTVTPSGCEGKTACRGATFVRGGAIVVLDVRRLVDRRGRTYRLVVDYAGAVGA